LLLDLGDKKIAKPAVTGENGWKTITNIPVYLPQGVHTLVVKGQQSRFAINWLDIKAI
jgi:hypothetical protein